jgi:hypothetical protein
MAIQLYVRKGDVAVYYKTLILTVLYEDMRLALFLPPD